MAVTPNITRVSPARAKALLARNESNRAVRPAYVRQLAEAMILGHWVFNGETIKVAEDGTLFDGQHRLLAVCQASVTVPMLIVEGLTQPVRDSIDTGRRRKLSDLLGIQGYKDGHGLATTLNSLHRHRVTGEFGRDGTPTSAQALELLRREPDIAESARVGRTLSQTLGGSVGTYGACHHIFKDNDPEKVDIFFERLRRGTNLGASNPILLLRSQLIRARMSPHHKLQPNAVAGLMFKAWVAWRDGRTLRLLTFKANGATVERLPLLEAAAEMPVGSAS